MGLPVLFEVRSGLKVTNGPEYLSGNGVPGASGISVDAPKGSQYVDLDTGFFYTKTGVGSGSDKWSQAAAQADLVAGLLGLSWREPAKLIDTIVYADMAEAETAMNLGTVDGQSVVNGTRVLYVGIAGSSHNVFIVTGTPGSGATLVEDGNDETKGDALFIQDGSCAGKSYAFNGTDWVQQGAASATEAGYLQAFVGKSGDGAEMPDYSSVNVVADGDSLETAVGKLDTEIGAGIATPASRTAGAISDQAVNLNIEQLDDAIGPNATSVNVVTASNGVNANISALDAEIGAGVLTANVRTAGAISDQAVNLNIEQLDDAIGPNVTSTNVVAAASAVNANISALDAKIGTSIAVPKVREEAVAVSASVTANLIAIDQAIGSDVGIFNFLGGVGENRSVWKQLATLDSKLGTVLVESKTILTVNAWTNVASVNCSQVVDGEFTVYAAAAGNKAYRATMAVSHNKTGAGDATDSGFNTYAIVKYPAKIAGLDFQTVLSGTGANQVVTLQAKATEAATVQVSGRKVMLA